MHAPSSFKRKAFSASAVLLCHVCFFLMKLLVFLGRGDATSKHDFFFFLETKAIEISNCVFMTFCVVFTTPVLLIFFFFFKA